MRHAISILVSTSALAFAIPAYGQTAQQAAPEATASDSNAIIVTARRRSEDVQDVPLVVNTITSDSIAKLNLQNFTEVQGLVPGLQLRVEPNGLGGSAQIRGVTFDINSSAQPTVEFYLNDAPITAAFVLQQMYDIDQIEVQRGPQGTLRGRSSPSGSITVSTRKPSLYDFGGYASMSGSDIGTINTDAAISAPIIKGVLGLRAAGIWSENDSNRVNTINTNLGGSSPRSRSRGGRFTALFTPADWLRLEGSYQRLDVNTRNYNQFASTSLAGPAPETDAPIITPDHRLSIEETPRSIKQKYEVYNWRAEGRFAGQTLIYQGQRSDSLGTSKNNNDAANYFQGVDFFQRLKTKYRATSHEVRLQNEERVAGIFDYVVGYFHQAQYSPTTVIVETPIALPAALGGSVVFIQPTVIKTTLDTKEDSFFGNLTATLGKVQLSGGLRHIDFRSPEGFLQIDANSLPGAQAIKDKKFIYTANASYHITPDIMIYASTGTSRRPGPTIVGNFSVLQSERERSFTYLQAEDSTSYEVGIKSTFLNGRGRLNLTAYHQAFTNYPYKLTTGVYYQNFTFVPGSGVVPQVSLGTQFAAAVPVTVNGAEVEFGFKVTPNFDLSVVASYADGKIKNGTIPCDDLNGDGVPDNLTRAPSTTELQAAYGDNYVGSCRVSQRASNQSPFSATIQAQYTLPVSNSLDFFARGLLAFQGSSIGDPANPYDSVGNYALFNMFTGIRDPHGKWEVNLFAKNLFDITKATSFGPSAITSYQELQPPTFQTTNGATANSPYSVITTNPPREFGINVRYAFGSR